MPKMTSQFKEHCEKCQFHREDINTENQTRLHMCGKLKQSALHKDNLLIWVDFLDEKGSCDYESEEKCPLYLEFVVRDSE